MNQEPVLLAQVRPSEDRLTVGVGLAADPCARLDDPIVAASEAL